jgi:hypothetical protein
MGRKGKQRILGLTTKRAFMNQLGCHLIVINRNVGEIGNLSCNLVSVVSTFAIYTLVRGNQFLTPSLPFPARICHLASIATSITCIPLFRVYTALKRTQFQKKP